MLCSEWLTACCRQSWRLIETGLCLLLMMAAIYGLEYSVSFTPYGVHGALFGLPSCDSVGRCVLDLAMRAMKPMYSTFLLEPVQQGMKTR